jgi:hypothetical protein
MGSGRGGGLVRRLLEQRIRRVVIKTRLVILASTSPQTVQTDLRHIVRNGVTSDGSPGRRVRRAASAPISIPSSTAGEGTAISSAKASAKKR